MKKNLGGKKLKFISHRFRHFDLFTLFFPGTVFYDMLKVTSSVTEPLLFCAKPCIPSIECCVFTLTDFYENRVNMYYQKRSGVSSWLSRLRIHHCHCCGSGYICGVGSIPRLGTSTCRGCSQKRKEKTYLQMDQISTQLKKKTT